MTTERPNSTTITLLLKHERTTLLFHISPPSPLSTLKAPLLKTLHQTNPSGYLSKTPPTTVTLPPQTEQTNTTSISKLKIPSITEPEKVIFAQPINPQELSKGFSRIFLEDDLDVQLDQRANSNSKDKGKDKGKAKAKSKPKRKEKSRTEWPVDCCRTLGLKDGGVLAFRFLEAGSLDSEGVERGGDGGEDGGLAGMDEDDEYDNEAGSDSDADGDMEGVKVTKTRDVKFRVVVPDLGDEEEEEMEDEEGNS